MSKQLAVPATLVDPRTDRVYKPCGAPVDGGFCARFSGHKTDGKKGAHRPTLERPLDPEKAAKREAWKALTPDEQKAELARRKAVGDEKRAASKQERSKANGSKGGSKSASNKAAASKRSTPPHARAMGSGAVARNARPKVAAEVSATL